MVSILLTIGGTVMNALAFSNTNFCSSKLVDHGGKECKRFHLVLENLQMARDGCNEDRMKQLDSINKKLHQRMKSEHTSTILMKQCLSTIEYF